MEEYKTFKPKRRNSTFFSRMASTGEKKARSQSRDTMFIRTDIIRFSKYINNLLKDSPSLSEEELEKIVIDDYYYNLAPKIMEANFSYEYYMDLLSCKYLQAHPDEFDKIYQKVSSPDFKSVTQYNSFNEAIENYVYKSLYTREEEIVTNAIENLPIEIQNILAENTSLEDRFHAITKYIKQNYNLSNDKNFLLQNTKIALFGVKHSLPDNQRLIETRLRNDLENSILTLISTLKSTGAYDKYIETNERIFSQLGFVSFHKGLSQDQDNIYLDLEQNPEVLNKFDVDTLILLNSFWLNRYTKELNAYANSLSVIHERHLIENIVNGEELNQDFLTADALKSVMIKKHALFPVIKNYISKVQQSIYDGNVEPGTIKIESLKNSDDQSYVLVSYDPLKSVVKKSKFDVEYKDYFDSRLPESENDAEKDVIFYATLLNPSIIAYNEKSNYLCALVNNLSNTNFINAGILPNGFINESKIELPGFIGIGVDAAGLTSPVREHMKLDQLRDFVKAYTGSSILPLYEGAEDFKFPFSSEFASAQLVLPISEKQTDLLKKLMTSDEQTNCSNKPLIEHLHFLSTPKRLPSSLIIEENGRKRPFKKRFVDLEDGQIYVIKDDKFVKYTPDKDTRTSERKTGNGDIR